MKFCPTIELTLEGETELWVDNPFAFGNETVFLFFETKCLDLLISFRSSNMYFTMLILCLVISLLLFPEEGSL